MRHETHVNVSLEVSNMLPKRFMIKHRKNIDAKLSRAANQHESKIAVSFGLVPRHLKLQ